MKHLDKTLVHKWNTELFNIDGFIYKKLCGIIREAQEQTIDKILHVLKEDEKIVNLTGSSQNADYIKHLIKTIEKTFKQ